MRSIDILERIGELSAQAEWTDEELDKALLEQGVDPYELVRMVMTEIEPILQNRSELSRVTDVGVGGSLPLIEVLRRNTNLSISAIAKTMDVSAGFLIEIARHPTAIPDKWREELINRATRLLDIEPTLIRRTLMTALPEHGAGLGQISRPTDTITYRGILDRSGMGRKEKQFWLNLASQETSNS